jgi:tetratricopeptide (TPR) repeat protein
VHDTLKYCRANYIGNLACLVCLSSAGNLFAQGAELRVVGPSHVSWAPETRESLNHGDHSPTRTTNPPISSTSYTGISRTSYSGDQEAGPFGRSSLETITPQAQAHINYALNLAERGAVLSAQAEFTMALDLIADALDADTGDANRSHAQAVKAGLKAIEETKDFTPAGTSNDISLDVLQLSANHQTPVLKNMGAERLSRAEALQRYHAFATQKLAYAAGNSPIGSAALYGLGRAQSVTTAGARTRNPLAGPNAMALYQAALIVDSKNYMACNELGVLMARYGNLEVAENQFVQSISIKPQPETWHNLSTVYRAMGQSEKASQAEAEREKLVAAARTGNGTTENANDLGSRPMLDFVDPDTFAAAGTPYGLDGPPISPTNTAPQQSFGKRLVAKLIPWPKGNKPEQAEEPPSSQRADSSLGGRADGRLLR